MREATTPCGGPGAVGGRAGPPPSSFRAIKLMPAGGLPPPSLEALLSERRAESRGAIPNSPPAMGAAVEGAGGGGPAGAAADRDGPAGGDVGNASASAAADAAGLRARAIATPVSSTAGCDRRPAASSVDRCRVGADAPTPSVCKGAARGTDGSSERRHFEHALELDGLALEAEQISNVLSAWPQRHPHTRIRETTTLG